MALLIRWVIGPVSPLGFDCLNVSTKLMQHLYPKARLVVCHNGLSEEQKTKLPPVELFEQKGDVWGPAWKLFPPRLDVNDHEILIDNDIVLYERSEIIEEFLGQTKLCVVTEAYKRSYSPQFEDLVPTDFNINSGLVCLPPGFDYGRSIQSVFDYSRRIKAKLWEDHFDEQTIVASVLSRNTTKIIPITDISVCVTSYVRGRIGTHFVGLNGTKTDHWQAYLLENLTL